uniref:Cytoplasmic dynein 2 light intermediate chain 1 n=1 Tax=Albugo laibachii Nc14 TaxID=890382 RepID=F0WSV2_9STRA|nr:conserved hypothetical protein [Albugo laibachii Nc14]|eukprot:CCA24433.1 conserved hypothetical protein [Albugo laibachii Nc14]
MTPECQEDKCIQTMDLKPTSKLSNDKDIWSILMSLDHAKRSAEEQMCQTSEEKDTATLVVGSKGSGKTTLIATLRGSTKVDDIKPTTALDYSNVRIKRAGKVPVAHIWELATTQCIEGMIRIPLSTERVVNSGIVITIDLSIPGDVVSYLVYYVTLLYRVVDEIIKKKEKNPNDKIAIDRLREEAAARFGRAHQDRNDVTLFPVPLLIIGNKYDVFRDEDSVKRKGINQAIRYLAHMYGATLLFTSTKEKAFHTSFRSMMKSFVFHSASGKVTKEVDSARPLFVPVGSDSFAEIGGPKSFKPTTYTKDQHEQRANQWKRVAAEYYAASDSVKEIIESESESGSKFGKVSEIFPEPMIDQMRARKTMELERYQKTRTKMRWKTISLVLLSTQLISPQAKGGVRIRSLQGDATNGSSTPPTPSPETPPSPPPETPPPPPPSNPPPSPPNPSPPSPSPPSPSPPSPSPPPSNPPPPPVQTPPPNPSPPPPPPPTLPSPPPSMENNENKNPNPPPPPPPKENEENKTSNPPQTNNPPSPPQNNPNSSPPKQSDTPSPAPTSNNPSNPPPVNPSPSQPTSPQPVQPQSQTSLPEDASGTPSDPNANTTSKKSAMSVGTVAGIVAGIIGGVAVLALCTICFLHRKKEMEDDPLSPFGASMDKGFQANSQESYNNIETRNHAPEPHPYAIPMDHPVERASQHRYYDAVTGPLTSPPGHKPLPPPVSDRIAPSEAPNLWVSAMESQSQDVDEDFERRSSLPLRKDSYVSARDSSIDDAKMEDQNSAFPISSPYSQGSYDGIPRISRF